MVDAERLLSILGRITARLRILEDYAAHDRDELLGACVISESMTPRSSPTCGGWTTCATSSVP